MCNSINVKMQRGSVSAISVRHLTGLLCSAFAALPLSEVMAWDYQSVFCEAGVTSQNVVQFQSIIIKITISPGQMVNWDDFTFDGIHISVIFIFSLTAAGHPVKWSVP